MKVKAIARGFYSGRLLEPGAVFDIVDDDAFGTWMEPIDEKDRVRLAERLKANAANRRAKPPAGVPPTTGPGYANALRDPPKTKTAAEVAAAAKDAKETKGEPPKAPAKEPKGEPPKA